MHCGWQLDGELDRPVVRNGGEFQLGHGARSQLWLVKGRDYQSRGPESRRVVMVGRDAEMGRTTR
jgi:hypothetical protein